ncbi:MAG: recombinase family protein [Gammaproteobacteria bacterium]|nr:recombinase family protein [Gammaproteobacteria bacterium]
MFEAMDEVHSLMSREKGLAGMAENVRQGWRAGGRAPLGYRLEAHTTGAIREGRPVTKTKLVPADRAREIAAYLKARSRGTPRSVAGRQIGISATTLIGVEWNALTYAGHTVWNVNDAHRRRPRDEWVIRRDTHPALISEAEAEAIIAQLETSKIGQAVSRGKQAMGDALLAGLLVTPEGVPWKQHGSYYRLRTPGRKGRLVQAAMLDRAVLRQVEEDTTSELYLKDLLAAARAYRAEAPRSHEAHIKRLERQRAKAARLALEEEAFLEIVADCGRQIEALRREAEAMQADTALSSEINALTVGQLRELLAEQDPAKRLRTLVEAVTLDAELRCRVHYKAVPGASAWRSVASPRGFEPLLPP